MTPEQKIKHLIIAKAFEWKEEPAPPITAGNIDALYEAEDGDDYELQDARNEIRKGEVETGLPCESSRHYEAKAVAAKAPDGSWVGWTYWYGGGKHGSPEEVDWMSGAYELACTEEERVVVVRTFAKVEVAA